MKNYYDILGISIDASLECIKDAYRKLAKKFHPDLNAGDEFFKKHFMSIQEAYEVLSSEAKRKVYDQQFANVDSKTLSEQIDEKIFAYRESNRKFKTTSQAYAATHPFENRFDRLIFVGQWFLGVVAIIVLLACILLMIQPGMPLKQLLFVVFNITKYLVFLGMATFGFFYCQRVFRH